MSYRNERFNKSMRSLDKSYSNNRQDRSRQLSDHGAGAALILKMADMTDARILSEHAKESRRRNRKLRAAKHHLLKLGKSYLIRTLKLIATNGKHFQISLEKIPRRSYFRHRSELIAIFCGTELHTDK